MKLYAVLVFDEGHKLLYSNYNLENFPFFYRWKIQENIENITTNLLKCVKLNNYHKINEPIDNNNFVVYSITTDKFYIAITDDIYLQRIAFTLLNTLKNSEFDKVEFGKLFMAYQDVNEIDKILKLRNELDETKLVLLDMIDKIIDRGESMNDLLERAERMNENSVLLRIKAKELNSCCTIF